MATSVVVMLGAMLSVTTPVEAEATETTTEASTEVYPLLPDLPGADISGEAGLVIYLRDGRALIEADGLYDLGDRPLEVGFDGLTEITLWFVLAEQSAETTLFVERDGLWTDTLGLRGTELHYVIRPGGASVYSFELADPGQRAPTSPDLVLVPIEDAPEPR
jgi:hypothetical protein